MGDWLIGFAKNREKANALPPDIHVTKPWLIPGCRDRIMGVNMLFDRSRDIFSSFFCCTNT